MSGIYLQYPASDSSHRRQAVPFVVRQHPDSDDPDSDDPDSDDDEDDGDEGTDDDDDDDEEAEDDGYSE